MKGPIRRGSGDFTGAAPLLPERWPQVNPELLDALIGERDDLRARLAKVEALCDDLEGYLVWCDGLIPSRAPRPENVRAFVGKVRAAARGEGA